LSLGSSVVRARRSAKYSGTAPEGAERLLGRHFEQSLGPSARPDWPRPRGVDRETRTGHALAPRWRCGSEPRAGAGGTWARRGSRTWAAASIARAGFRVPRPGGAMYQHLLSVPSGRSRRPSGMAIAQADWVTTVVTPREVLGCRRGAPSSLVGFQARSHIDPAVAKARRVDLLGPTVGGNSTFGRPPRAAGGASASSWLAAASSFFSLGFSARGVGERLVGNCGPDLRKQRPRHDQPITLRARGSGSAREVGHRASAPIVGGPGRIVRPCERDVASAARASATVGARTVHAPKLGRGLWCSSFSVPVPCGTGATKMRWGVLIQVHPKPSSVDGAWRAADGFPR